MNIKAVIIAVLMAGFALVDIGQAQIPGDYLMEWDARERPSGVYFYRLVTQDTAVTGRMTLLR